MLILPLYAFAWGVEPAECVDFNSQFNSQIVTPSAFGRSTNCKHEKSFSAIAETVFVGHIKEYLFRRPGDIFGSLARSSC